LCLYYAVHGELNRARDEVERLLSLAEQAGDIGYQLGCHFHLGAAMMYQADLEPSRWHLEQAVNLYDQSRDRDLAYSQGQDPAVASLLYLSRVLWLQGEPEQAKRKIEEALSLAEALDHPYTSTLAAFFASILHELMRQWPQCQAQTEAALEVADQGPFRVLQAGCVMLRGSALVHQGHVDEGIAILRQGLAGWKATGCQLALPYFLAGLAEAYLIAGKREEGLEALYESVRYVEESWWLPEQYRLRAELLLLVSGNEVEAEDCLRQAIELARSQKSKSLELRAVMSLARLLRKQGRAAEGRDLLAECYAWFTEGFDTPDLQEARALLEELAPVETLVPS
jgi:predicted ATPase